MNVTKRSSLSPFIPIAVLIGGLLLSRIPLLAEQPGLPAGASQSVADSTSPAVYCEQGRFGSPYIPVDSWVYPAMLRLYSMGFVDDVFLGLRPWTRVSVRHMLEAKDTRILIQDAVAEGASSANEAEELFRALSDELDRDESGPCPVRRIKSHVESVYSVARAITGTPLRDSYHLGSTIINDYGRPYEGGFNDYSGASGYSTAGPFTLYERFEFQRAPSAAGYSPALAQTLSALDEVPYKNASGVVTKQATIPEGPIASTTQMRVVEAYASAQYLNHIFSFGKQDNWTGPGQGGAMAYSNNAEDIYTFRINRIEPLPIPFLSQIIGPFRYDFMVGSLKGHTSPEDPWMHLEKVSFRPTDNLEFGFERTVIWGGKGHVPVTIGTFLRSFFSLVAPDQAVKFSRKDPGARFGSFDFSYRLPFVRNWLTLYTDSEAHDDVSPTDAPRHASVRPGLYLSHVPGISKLDIRVEGVSTDPPTSRSQGGQFEYFEGVQVQGYTSNGALFGDWIGREDKGGQGWITYHLSGNEWLQISARNQKADKDFIPGSTTSKIQGGTTLNDLNFQMVKRIGKDFEINANFSYEEWKAPIYLPGLQTVTNTTIQLIWFPARKVSF